MKKENIEEEIIIKNNGFISKPNSTEILIYESKDVNKLINGYRLIRFIKKNEEYSKIEIKKGDNWFLRARGKTDSEVDMWITCWLQEFKIQHVTSIEASLIIFEYLTRMFKEKNDSNFQNDNSEIFNKIQEILKK